MIFGSLEEAERVHAVIEAKEDFEDLTSTQMMGIRGMYLAVECLESEKYEYEVNDEDSTLDKIQKEIAVAVIDACIERVNAEIAEMYVSFCDDNTEIE